MFLTTIRIAKELTLSGSGQCKYDVTSTECDYLVKIPVVIMNNASFFKAEIVLGKVKVRVNKVRVHSEKTTKIEKL